MLFSMHDTAPAEVPPEVPPKKHRALPGAGYALGLLLAINLFNYIDRQVLAAVEPNIRHAFFAEGDPTAPGYVVYVWKDGAYDYAPK